MRRYLLGSLLLGLALGCAKAEPKINEDPTDAGGSAGVGGGAGNQAAGASGEGGGGGASGEGGAGAAGSDAGGAGQGGSDAGSGGSDAGAGGSEQGGAGQGGAGAAGESGAAGVGGDPPKPCPNKPLINELMSAREEGGKVDEKYEFIELLAVGEDEGCAISLLDGYKLYFNNSEIWGGAVSPSFKKGKRFVLGGESYSADGKPTDQGLPQPSLPVSGGCVELRKDGSVVDRVCYGGAGQAPAPAPGQSVGRSPDGADTDVDKDDFVIFDTPTPNGKNP
jgi:hypothetical protein